MAGCPSCVPTRGRSGSGWRPRAGAALRVDSWLSTPGSRFVPHQRGLERGDVLGDRLLDPGPLRVPVVMGELSSLPDHILPRDVGMHLLEAIAQAIGRFANDHE